MQWCMMMLRAASGDIPLVDGDGPVKNIEQSLIHGDTTYVLKSFIRWTSGTKGVFKQFHMHPVGSRQRYICSIFPLDTMQEGLREALAPVMRYE